MKDAPSRHPLVPSRIPPPETRGPGRAHGRVLALGFSLSALLHLLLFFFASRATYEIHVDRPSGRSIEETRAGTPELQTLRIAIVADGEVEALEAARQDPIEERTPPVAAPQRGPVAGPSAGPGISPPATGETSRDAADRLRPQMGDPRLWRRYEPPFPEAPTDLDHARTRIYGRLDEFNDSMAVEAGRAERATDWTVRDGDGGRWGVSPGKIHLGNLTLPLPVNLSSTPARRQEAAARASQDAEIARQGETEAFRENFRDRVREIRERKDREREQSRGNPGPD